MFSEFNSRTNKTTSTPRVAGGTQFTEKIPNVLPLFTIQNHPKKSPHFQPIIAIEPIRWPCSTRRWDRNGKWIRLKFWWCTPRQKAFLLWWKTNRFSFSSISDVRVIRGLQQLCRPSATRKSVNGMAVRFDFLMRISNSVTCSWQFGRYEKFITLSRVGS